MCYKFRVTQEQLPRSYYRGAVTERVDLGSEALASQVSGEDESSLPKNNVQVVFGNILVQITFNYYNKVMFIA